MDKEECVAMELAAGDGFRQVGTHAYLLILYIYAFVVWILCLHLVVMGVLLLCFSVFFAFVIKIKFF